MASVQIRVNWSLSWRRASWLIAEKFLISLADISGTSETKLSTIRFHELEVSVLASRSAVCKMALPSGTLNNRLISSKSAKSDCVVKPTQTSTASWMNLEKLKTIRTRRMGFAMTQTASRPTL